MPATRHTSPPASHLAEQRIKTAQAKSDNPEEVADPVKACCQMGRNFTGSEIEKLMKLHYPGPNEKSGSICSPERIRGVLSDLKKSGDVVPVELDGERGVYRWVAKDVKQVQTSMFD